MEEEQSQTVQQYTKIRDGIKTPNQVKRIIAQMKNSQDLENKLIDINVLLDTNITMLDQITSTPCLRYTVEWLNQAANKLEEEEELVEKILLLYLNMNFTQQHFDHSKLPLIIREYQSYNLQDKIHKRVFQLYVKQKQKIEEWLKLYDQGKKNLPDHNKKRDFKQINQNRRQEPNDKVNKKVQLNNNNNNKNNGYKNQNRKKGVVWRDDEELCDYKVFIKNDEPSKQGLSEEEHEKFLQHYVNNGHLAYNDYKSKDQEFEKIHRQQQMNEIAQLNQKLKDMQPQLKSYPKIISIYVDPNYDEAISSNSKEKQLHQERIASKLPAKYMTKSDIPSDPVYSKEILESEKNYDINKEDAKITKIQLMEQSEEDFLQVIKIEMKASKERQEQMKNEKQIKGILKKSKQELQDIEKKNQKIRQEFEQNVGKIPKTVLEDLSQILQNDAYLNKEGEEQMLILLKNDIKDKKLIQYIIQNLEQMKNYFIKQAPVIQPPPNMMQQQNHQQFQNNYQQNHFQNNFNPKNNTLPPQFQQQVNNQQYNNNNYNNNFNNNRGGYNNNRGNQNSNFTNNNYKKYNNNSNNFMPQNNMNQNINNNQVQQNQNFPIQNNNPSQNQMKQNNPLNINFQNNQNNQNNNNNNNNNQNQNQNVSNQQNNATKYQNKYSGNKKIALPDPSKIGIQNFNQNFNQDFVRNENFLLQRDQKELEEKEKQRKLEEAKNAPVKKEGRHDRNRPCVFYHSHTGCPAGETCDYIHNPDYKGKPVPGMEKYIRNAATLSKKPEQNMMNYLLLTQNSSSGEKLDNINPQQSYMTYKGPQKFQNNFKHPNNKPMQNKGQFNNFQPPQNNFNYSQQQNQNPQMQMNNNNNNRNNFNNNQNKFPLPNNTQNFLNPGMN